MKTTKKSCTPWSTFAYTKWYGYRCTTVWEPLF